MSRFSTDFDFLIGLPAVALTEGQSLRKKCRKVKELFTAQSVKPCLHMRLINTLIGGTEQWVHAWFLSCVTGKVLSAASGFLCEPLWGLQYLRESL